MDAGLTNLLIALGTALGIPIAGALGTLGVKAIQLQTLKLGDRSFARKTDAARYGVFAAEQLAKSGVIAKEQRKAKALELAGNMLAESKVKYDPSNLSGMVESLVWSDTPSVSTITTVTTNGAKTPTTSTTTANVVPSGIVLPPPGG